MADVFRVGKTRRMIERDYWVGLEFRVCRELAGMPEHNFRFLWCDGFVPTRYLLEAPSPRIEGRAWICNGPRQDEWDFTLILSQPADSSSEIDWASLLPPDDVTEWMDIDLVRKHIEMNPMVAVAE